MITNAAAALVKIRSIASVRRALAPFVALLLALMWVPALVTATPASADGIVLTKSNTNCQGVITTPGSENTDKKLVGGDLIHEAIYQITYPIDPADIGQDFDVIDCPILGGDVNGAQAWQFSFVPNNTSFTVTFAVDIPAGTPIGTTDCNYAKTVASPSAPQASNRKAGPSCFTVGGNLLIEKHATGNTNDLLPGAEFSVSCPTAAPTVPITEVPVVVSGLVDGNHDAVTASYVTKDGAWEASGIADPGSIGIVGPSGTDCTVTETAPPAGYLLPATTTQHYTIPVGTSQQVVDWFNAPAVANVHLAKSAHPASGSAVDRGSRIDYTLAYYNDGNADASNATITDTLPNHTTYVDGTASDGGTYDDATRTITWSNVGTVPAGTSAESPAGTRTFSVTVDADTANGTELDNTGHIQLGEDTPIDSNTTQHFVKFAVLDIAKTASPASGTIVQRGDQIDYTVTVTNTGLAAALAQTVTDTLPANVTVVPGSISPAAQTADATDIVWSVDVPAASESGPGTVVLKYSATVDADAPLGSTQTNVATLGDHTSTTDHHVPTGALTLVKHVDKTSASYGGTLTYTFDAASTGALDQTNVVVTDVLPAKTTYVNGSARCTDGGTCTATFDKATRTVTWTLGDIAAGAPARHLSFQVTIDTPNFDSQTGLPAETIVNAGRIASTETGSTPSNQVKTTVVAVLGVKVVRKPRLPFTGLPVTAALAAALTLMGAGVALTTVRRRKRA
jgi:uncharacterized repeat protein (TIGR01451 family)